MMNLPNALALLRVMIAPIVFWLLIDRDNAIFEGIHPSWIDYTAALLFVIAGVTDFFDGYIARMWNQATKLGAILDPLADKMLTLGAFLGLMMMGRADAWAIYLILTREFFITGLRVMAVQENRDVSASRAGKLKTFTQLIAIGFLIMDWPYAMEILWFSVFMTLYSGYEYVRVYAKDGA